MALGLESISAVIAASLRMTFASPADASGEVSSALFDFLLDLSVKLLRFPQKAATQLHEFGLKLELRVVGDRPTELINRFQCQLDPSLGSCPSLPQFLVPGGEVTVRPVPLNENDN